MDRSISFVLNGNPVALRADPERRLLDVLRGDCGLSGPKYGCGLGQCGACTVLVDGAPARACILRVGRVAGRRITTLEGLADRATGALHPVQAAFLAEEAAQCGYCLNGMVMTSVALLARNPTPDDDEIRAALRHNLCRCGAHVEVMRAVRRAAGRGRAPQETGGGG